MKNIAINTLILSICIILQANAQPAIEWQTNLGGSNIEHSQGGVLVTNDGGYAVLGLTYSNNFDVSTNNGQADIWLAKMDANGNLEWEQNYGGSDIDVPQSIVNTSDDGFLFMASTSFSPGMWLVKLSSTGSIEWNKSVVGEFLGVGRKLIQTNDNGYIMTGDGSAGPSSGHQVLLKINANGDIEWEQAYDVVEYFGSDALMFDVKQTNDGGFITVGSASPSLTEPKKYYVVKTDQMGNLQWEKYLGGSDDDHANSVELTSDGGYLVFGESRSTDGDVENNIGQYDVWIVKLDALGNIVWEKSIGTGFNDGTDATTADINGGFIIAGYSSSTGPTFNDRDGWIIKIDEDANILWEQLLGGSNIDGFSGVRQAMDEGYIIYGDSESDDGDLDSNYGMSDLWVVKLVGEATDVKSLKEGNVNILPNPSNGDFSISLENEGDYNISIIDVLGRQIFEENFQSNSFAVNGFSPGLYWVNIVQNGVAITRKLVVQD